MKHNRGLRVVISAFALAAAGVHILMPTAKIDSITIILFVLAAIPWVQPLIKSIELLGVKLELQELQTKVAEARGVGLLRAPLAKRVSRWLSNLRVRRQ